MNASTKPPTQGLERAYERYRRPMLRAARAWFPALRGLEADLYQGAWASVLRDVDGHEGEDLRKRLEHAVYWQGLQELRTRRRRPTVPLEAAAPGNGSNGCCEDPAPDYPDDTAVRPDEQAELREMAHLAEEVIAELTPRQQRIIKIQWGWGLPREQVASLLGLSERQVKRELEDAAPLIARNVELVKAERWCEARRSLVVAYACQVLSPRRTAIAEQHLEHCPGCRQLARAVGQRLDTLGAIAPAGPALEPPAERALPHIGTPFEWVRHGATDLAASAKQHATSLLARTPAGDGTTAQLAAGGGLRGSGGMAAAAVACIAVSGGATYCAVEGVPRPFHDSNQVAKRQEPRRERETKRQRGADERAAVAAPVVTTTEEPSPVDSRESTDANTEAQSAPTPQATVEQPPPPPPDEAAPSPAPTGSAEFGSASSPAPASPAPAPAPTSGGGEFGP